MGEANEDDEGWDMDVSEEPDPNQIYEMNKTESTNSDFLNDFAFFKADDIMSQRIPIAINKVD
jgi:hypothetical protein